jgi:hypothetical protein
VRKLRWTVPDRSLPKHRIRDSILLYAFMACVIVGVSIATGGSAVRAVVVAAVFWAVATTWAVVRFRRMGQRGRR